MKRLRLLYLFPEPLPIRKARGVQVMNTVHSLAGQPMDVALAYVPSPDGGDPFAAYGLSHPHNVRYVPLSRSLPWPLHWLRTHSGGLFHQRLTRWLRREASASRAPDAVMVRHVKIAHRLLQDFPDLPLIYEAHELFADGAPSAKAEWLAALEHEVLQRAAAVVAISRQLAGRLKQRFELQREIQVIPSATSLRQASGEKDWGRAGENIVYAGSLYGWKGVQDLVAAAAYLPGFRISLIGGDRESIAALRAQLSSGGAAVEFLGHLPHQEVVARLGQACIAVLPNRAGSVSEFTSPLKLFEYMAAGCAIAVSDLPVMREILDTSDAAWFSPGDPKALAQAIRQLADNPEYAKNMGRIVQNKVRNYSWEARARRLYKIVAAVAGKGEEAQ